MQQQKAKSNTEQQDLMNYLQQRIQQIEQKLKMTTGHLKMQEEEYKEHLDKMVSLRNRYSKVILLLTEFIESFVEKDPSLLQRQNDIFLDIDAVKEADDVRDIDPETLVALGLVLLKQLQPYLHQLQTQEWEQGLSQAEQGGITADGSVLEEDRFEEGGNTENIRTLEARNVTLKQREDEQKLSFMRKMPQVNNPKQNNLEDIYEQHTDLQTRVGTVAMLSNMNES